MSTVKTTYIQHPSSPTANIQLNSDGTITANVDDSGQTVALIIALVIALGG